ncbi:MAG: hypothetical protein ACREUU_03970 [Gammaproteobacteria bacterium]
MASIGSNPPYWYQDVKKVFDNLGVPESVWFPIMWTESRGRPLAVNDTRGQDTRPGTRPEWSIGLFQVNVEASGLNETDKAALAERLKDPVYNASFHGPRIAAAWNVLKGADMPESDWAPQVAIRSGHPGGHPDSPCITGWCAEAIHLYKDAAVKYLAGAINLVTGAVGGGVTSPPGSTGGGVVGVVPGVLPGVVGAGAFGGGSAVASGVADAANASAQLTKLLRKIQSPEFAQRMLVIGVGSAIVVVSVWAILWEQPQVRALRERAAGMGRAEFAAARGA